MLLPTFVVTAVLLGAADAPQSPTGTISLGSQPEKATINVLVPGKVELLVPVPEKANLLVPIPAKIKLLVPVPESIRLPLQIA
jgi:hypothetical protein